jgi:hypothetical protein
VRQAPYMASQFWMAVLIGEPTGGKRRRRKRASSAARHVLGIVAGRVPGRSPRPWTSAERPPAFSLVLLCRSSQASNYLYKIRTIEGETNSAANPSGLYRFAASVRPLPRRVMAPVGGGLSIIVCSDPSTPSPDPRVDVHPIKGPLGPAGTPAVHGTPSTASASWSCVSSPHVRKANVSYLKADRTR